MNLLAPTLLAEVVIHVLPDGRRRVYCSKLDVPPEQVAMIVQNLFAAAMDMARQCNVQVNVTPGGMPS